MAQEKISPSGIIVSRHKVSGKGRVFDFNYGDDATRLEHYPNSGILTWPIRTEIGPAEFVIGLRSLLRLRATHVSLHETDLADPINRDIAPKRNLGWLMSHEAEVIKAFQVIELEDTTKLEDTAQREVLFWQRAGDEGRPPEGSFVSSHMLDRPIETILATTGTEPTTARSQQLANLILQALMQPLDAKPSDGYNRN